MMEVDKPKKKPAKKRKEKKKAESSDEEYDDEYLSDAEGPDFVVGVRLPLTPTPTSPLNLWLTPPQPKEL